MAPGIHPPCTPPSSCQPTRCHPTPPPCAKPEKCLMKTIKKGTKPCESAVSILATRSSRCGTCGMFNTKNFKNHRNQKYVVKYLKRRRKEARLAKKDRINGTFKLEKYRRKQGNKRMKRDCCAGHGHRGRLKRGRKKGPGPPGRKRCCTIL